MITLNVEYAVSFNRRAVLQIPGSSFNEELDQDLLMESVKEKDNVEDFDSLDEVSYRILHVEREPDDWEIKNSSDYEEEYSMMTNDDLYELFSCGGEDAAEFVALPPEK